MERSAGQFVIVKLSYLELRVFLNLFVLRKDALNCALGAALMEVHDGKDYFLAYGSKKLTSAKRWYSGKGVPSHCMGGIQISAFLGWQIIYFTDGQSTLDRRS